MRKLLKIYILKYSKELYRMSEKLAFTLDYFKQHKK